MRKQFRIIKFKKNKPVLQVKNISKQFQGRPVLKKIGNKALYILYVNYIAREEGWSESVT